MDIGKFTWEAFATLATGLAAVGGAIYIGVKQVAITKKQAEITDRQTLLLAQQVHVDQLALRAELFERRLKVYDATKAYLRDIAKTRNGEFGDADIWMEFARQIELARFLFDGSVQREIDRVADTADRLLEMRETVKEARQAGGSISSEAAQAVRHLSKDLRENMTNLPDILGDEMRLYVARESAATKTNVELTHPETGHSA